MKSKENTTTNKVEVLIGGEVITLRSNERVEHLHRLARYVDEKITTITAKTRAAVLSERVRSVLIALNVADDYFKSVDSFKDVELTQKKTAKEISQLQKENTLLQQRIKELQEELGRTRVELNEFINNFDQEHSDNIVKLPHKHARKVAR